MRRPRIYSRPATRSGGLLAIAEAGRGEAFGERARTLQSLGLAGHSRDGMRELLWKGI